MNAPAPAAAAEKPLPSKSSFGLSNVVEEEKSRSSNPKPLAHLQDDAERIRSALARLSSNSVDELEELIAELHEVREFLKSEGERVQREIVTYAQLNQSALAATKIITGTIGPWKSAAVAGEAHDSGSGANSSTPEIEKNVTGRP